MPTLADLRRNQVKSFGPHTLVPGWKEEAATWGRDFVASKVFPNIRHPSGYRPGVKWFAGEPADAARGVAFPLDLGVIWLSAKMASHAEIIQTAAHETVHSYEYTQKEHYHDHELPTLVGRLAAAHWKGDRAVYVKWGPMPDTWLPEGEKELPSHAVVLHFENGDHETLVNAGNQYGRPRWHRRELML